MEFLGTPNWELILKFVQALAWPFTALVGIASLRPLVSTLAARGGNLTAFGLTVDLKAAENIDDAARLVENVVAEKPELAIKTPEVPSAVYDQSGYDLIQTGWKSLYQSLDGAARKYGKRKLDARKPTLAIDFLKKKNVLTDDLHDAIAKLWKVRNQVRHNGPSRFELSNISDSEAREFFETATRIAAMLTDKAPAAYTKASDIAASLIAKFPNAAGSNGTSDNSMH